MEGSERMVIENAAESVIFPSGGTAPDAPAGEPESGQPDVEVAEPTDGGETAAGQPTKPAAAPKAPSGLDKLRLFFGGEQATTAPEPEPTTAEGRIKQLVDRNSAQERQIAALTERLDRLSAAPQPEAPRRVPTEVLGVQELVKALPLKGMDPEAAQAFREDFGPAFAELASALYERDVAPLKQEIATLKQAHGEQDLDRFERELRGYLGDIYDESLEKQVGEVLKKSGASWQGLNDPRLAAVFIMGVRSMFGGDALEAIKAGAERDLRGRMARTDLTPSRAGQAGVADAPTRLLLGEDYFEHKRRHGRDLD